MRKMAACSESQNLLTVTCGMSLLTKLQRISVPQFASVQSLGSLPSIHRASASVSNASTYLRGAQLDLRGKGCIVTKSVKCTHQLVHWVNTVCSGDNTPIVGNEFICEVALTESLVFIGGTHRIRPVYNSVRRFYAR